MDDIKPETCIFHKSNAPWSSGFVKIFNAIQVTYQFTTIPNKHDDVMLVFTKILKPPFTE